MKQKRKMKKNRCEFCTKIFMAQYYDTVCGACDAELESQQNAERIKKEEKHALKFKCHGCGKGLPLSRARHCFDCLPTEASQSRFGKPFESIDEDYLLCS